GLFLAPFLENHLPGIFALLLLMPVGILFAAWTWSRLPQSVRLAIPEGWEAVLLIPVILLVGFGSLEISGHLENWFFGGDMRLW
ncbi:phosphate ABC transporter permease, partial [Pseudomonas aeruginosa]|nr:phosphate ABC transporter permease [Pseudomonas aeruginosa]